MRSTADLGVDWVGKDEFNQRIEQYCEDFQGQSNDLYAVVGAAVVGRLFGWRFVRLTSSRRVWRLLIVAFGDPKEWMPEYGRLSRKSVGLKIIEKFDDFWDFINGNRSREGLTLNDRKTII